MTAPLDADMLARLREALDKASKPPWKFPHRNWPGVVMTPLGCLWNPSGFINDPADAELIVLLRNAAPALLAELVRARQTIARVEAALDALASDAPGEMLVLPPEHHPCERVVVGLVVKALRVALAGRDERQATT